MKKCCVIPVRQLRSKCAALTSIAAGVDDVPSSLVTTITEDLRMRCYSLADRVNRLARSHPGVKQLR